MNGSLSTLTEHAEVVRLESPASRPKDGLHDVGTSHADPLVTQPTNPIGATMKSDMRTENIVRESVLKLLSDDEVASVSTAETAARLLDGEEYLDLEQLERGVQQARKAGPAMGRVLPRRTVHKDTWSKILTVLGPVHCTENCCKGEKAKPVASP